MSIFHKNSGKGYNICRKFQIGKNITNLRAVHRLFLWPSLDKKIHNFWNIVLKMEAIFSQNSPQNRTLETSIRHKNSEKGPTFSSKIPERVDIEIL